MRPSRLGAQWIRGVRLRRLPAVVFALLLAPLGAAAAQDIQLDTSLVALTYHRASGDPLDLRKAAELSAAVQGASNFDRADVTNQEMARLQAQLASADTSHEFVVRVNDRISEYDHARGEFTIGVFQPGTSVPVRAFGQQYNLVFANAAAMGAIAMPTDQARAFDASLNGFGRQVTDEIHFRVVGAGDPAGAVTGPRVIRANAIAARILDPSGRVVAAPSAATAPATRVAKFDAATVDVAGLRVGTRADDVIATLKRLFGDVVREPVGRGAHPGLTSTLTVNDAGCYSMPGQSRSPKPGAVCVTALVDDHDVVRSIRVERVFPWMDEEVFRKTLVQKYGPVAGAQDAGGFTLGWGPPVAPDLLYDRSGPPNALTAQYVSDDDYMSRGLNALPKIRVVLSLVDASWAGASEK
jgi:hypothetical protein